MRFAVGALAYSDEQVKCVAHDSGFASTSQFDCGFRRLFRHGSGRSSDASPPAPVGVILRSCIGARDSAARGVGENGQSFAEEDCQQEALVVGPARIKIWFTTALERRRENINDFNDSIRTVRMLDLTLDGDKVRGMESSRTRCG